MKAMNPHATVIVLNWNGWQDTIQCLASLVLQEYFNMSIIVIDNASSDDSREKILKWAATGEVRWIKRLLFITCGEPINYNIGDLCNGDFVYIQSKENGGFAAGNNLGIRLAIAHGAMYVWILNNDTEVDAFALAALVDCAEKDPKIGMCGSTLIYHDSRDQIQACGGVNFDYWRALGKQLGHGLDPKSIDIETVVRTPLSYISGASLLARVQMIMEIGVLEERYFLYFEEIDWAERAKGWKLAFSKNSIVFHKEGASIGTASRKRRSELSQYYLNRNIIIFYIRFHKALLPIAVSRVIRELFHQFKKGDSKLVKITWRALIDGLFSRDGQMGFVVDK